jgi:hypothetical protein
MVILQTTEDSLQATLHELTEVMRYERLATAELATVYEKGGPPVPTAPPPGRDWEFEGIQRPSLPVSAPAPSARCLQHALALR